MEFLAQIVQETLDDNKWVNIVTVHRANVNVCTSFITIYQTKLLFRYNSRNLMYILTFHFHSPCDEQ